MGYNMTRKKTELLSREIDLYSNKQTSFKAFLLPLYIIIATLVFILIGGFIIFLINSEPAPGNLKNCPQNENFSAEHGDICAYFSVQEQQFYYFKLVEGELKYHNICEVR